MASKITPSAGLYKFDATVTPLTLDNNAALIDEVLNVEIGSSVGWSTAGDNFGLDLGSAQTVQYLYMCDKSVGATLTSGQIEIYKSGDNSAWTKVGDTLNPGSNWTRTKPWHTITPTSQESARYWRIKVTTLINITGAACETTELEAYEPSGVVTESGSIQSDSHIQATETSTIQSDAYVGIVETSTITSDSHIQTTETDTLQSDAHIFKTEAVTIQSDAYIIGIETQTIQSNAYVYKTGTSTINSNAKVVWRDTNTLQSDAHIFKTETVTIQSDAGILKDNETVTILSDAVVLEGPDPYHFEYAEPVEATDEIAMNFDTFDIKLKHVCNHRLNNSQYTLNTCPRCLGTGYYYDAKFNEIGRLVEISLEDKLQQALEKLVLTDENKFHEDVAIGLKKWLGEVPISKIKAIIKYDLVKSLAELQKTQKGVPDLATSAQIASVDNIEVYENPESPSILEYLVEITTVAGDAKKLTGVVTVSE